MGEAREGYEMQSYYYMREKLENKKGRKLTG